MSILTKLFQKKKDDDYETILSTLASDIQKRQVKLSEIRLRERRATLLVTMYTLAAWVAYVSVWYMDILPNTSGRRVTSRASKAMRGFPVVIGPIIILFIRRIVQIWYSRKGDAEERTLQQLLRQQRTKIEEIKKKTNYYSTRDLIQRYDESSPSPTANPRQRPVVPQTPQRQPPAVNTNPQTPVTPALKQQLSPIPSTPPTGPLRKQWFDKLADAVLGEEDSSRYALICQKCFSHNGLVKESVWEDTQYVCPKCGHFNPSLRSRKLGSVSALSASSPVTPGVITATPRHLAARRSPQETPSTKNSNGSSSRGAGQEQDAPKDEGSLMDTTED